jgi:competence protein ComEC
MAAGIAVVAWLPQLPPVWLLLVVIIGCAALGCRFMLRSRGQTLDDLQSPHELQFPRKTTQRFTMSLLALMLGICWGCGYGFYIRSGLLPVELEQQSLLLRGRVVGLVEQQTGFQQSSLLHFQFELDPKARDTATPSPRLIQLNWYDAAAVLQSGEYWQLRVKLKRPRGFANPAGFDYAAWLVANRIGATGYVERGADNQRLAAASIGSVDALRGRAQNYLQQRLQNFAHRDLLLGLLIGDGGAIATTEWETFRATGTVHLFVVSGLQIAFTGGIALWCSRLWWRSPLIASRRRNYLLGSIPALAIALIYALLAGWGLPIQRALIMFAVLMWALSL